MECKIGGLKIPFMIDSGASIDTVSEAMWNELSGAYKRGEAFTYDLKHTSNRSVFAYASRHPLEIKATFKAWVSVASASKPHQFVEFFVIKGASKSLLSRSTAKRMKLLKIGLEVNEVSVAQGGVVIEAPIERQSLKPFPKVPGGPIDFEIDETV